MALFMGQSCLKPSSRLKLVFNLTNNRPKIVFCRPLLSFAKSFGSGNDDDNPIIKKTYYDEGRNFPKQRKRMVSPIARLSHILPHELQATQIFDSDKDKDIERTKKRSTDKNRIHENASSASYFDWSEPDEELIDKNMNVDIRNFQNNDEIKQRNTNRTKFQRLSGHLPKDLIADLDKQTDNLPYSNVNNHSLTMTEMIDLHNVSEATHVPNVSPKTIQYGCLVVLNLFGWTKGPQQYKYMFKLEKGKFFHIKSYGNLSHDKIINKEPGQIIKITPKKMALISFPTLEDFITLMPKKLVAANPKTVTSMIYMADIHEGSRVLEAGSGAGGTTLLLSRAVGSRGQVVSIEKNKIMSELAQENVDKWNNQSIEIGCETSNNIRFLHGYITKVNDKDLFNIDAVFLDMKNPVDALDNVSQYLRVGAVILVYTPSVSTVLSCVRSVHASCPSLRVEGVFEDTQTLWKVNAAENKCHPYKRDERQTLFILKLMKIKVFKQSKDEQEVNSTYSSRFSYGDYVCVEYLNQNRKGKKIQCVTKLTDSGQLALLQRNLRHSDIIGTQSGSVLQLDHFPPLLVSIPTLETFVETLDGNRGLLSLQLYRLICHALDVKKGDTVLHIGRQINQCTASAAYFSQTVGETGEVYCVTEMGEVLEDCVNNLETWRKVISQRRGKDVSMKIHLKVDIHELSSDIQFDGISSDLPMNSLVKNLSFISARLKMGKCVAVFFPSVTSILQLDEYLMKNNLPLHIKQVYEEREREWLVQPVKIAKSQEDLKYDESNWPYVCRPKQKTTCSNSGLIAILQKVVQLG